MHLNSTFKKISEKFNIDFDQLASVHGHNLTAGEAREDALCQFLKENLPKRVGIDKGFVIDAHGKESLQMDIVIYDKTVGTVFKINNVNYFPCEIVIAVGEVKSDITSNDKLNDSLKKIASAKVLDRSNNNTNMMIAGPGISLGSLIKFDPTINHRDQIFGFIFTKTTMKRDTVINSLQAYNKTTPRNLWTNLFCAYGDFLISYEIDKALYPSAMDAKYFYCTKDTEVPNLLLLFYSIFGTFVNEAHVARPNYFSYLNIASTGATYHQLTPEEESS